MLSREVGRSFRLAVMVIASLFAIGFAGGALAQDTTPEAEIVTHPAHIHAGTCADLDPNPMAPLNNVGPQTNDDGDLPASEDVRGSLTAAAVEVSKTEDVEASFDDILDEAHAINVHESDQNPQNYIACGDIGGPVIDDTLTIGLQEQNNSGYTGIAIIEKDGDDHVKVTVYLTSAPASEEVTPEATPGS